MNDCQQVKPLVWVNEIPWHEMNVNEELTPQATDPFYRGLEMRLRRTLYQWHHLRGDMIVEPTITCPLAIKDTQVGITEQVDVRQTDPDSSIVSRSFHIQIQNVDDLEKIKLPVVTYDPDVTERNYARMQDIFDGILQVEKAGKPGFWFAPWDELVRWWGVEEALLDLISRPELVHKAMQRLVTAHLHRLEQYEEQGLLASNNGNHRIGSGGLGYTNQLPPEDYSGDKVPAKDLWGSAAAQIFSSVSPAMHEEFALKYEIQWMERFGLNYYGCCEPLHDKIGILEQIPNLRKVSISPWADVDKSAEAIGTKYVYSYKPNPAILVNWDPKPAKTTLEDILKRIIARGCPVEVIMKDISTVAYQPQRLWEWVRIAEEVTEALT